MNIFSHRLKRLSDTEIIVGLQHHDTRTEKYFFDVAYSYFDLHFNQLFFDSDSKHEIFQTAIIKLWTEIENKTIRIIDNKVCRRQKTGAYTEMTASLTTFMMTFAKNEFREMLRNYKDDNYEEFMCYMEASNEIADEIYDEDDRIQIIDECILSMSPTCIEIITLFYYKKKTLDEIMEIRGEKNSSKDGLKTAKNKCMVTLRKRVDELIKYK